MTKTITGAVTVGGVRYPVQVQVDLPDAAPVQLRIVPKAS